MFYVIYRCDGNSSFYCIHFCTKAAVYEGFNLYGFLMSVQTPGEIIHVPTMSLLDTMINLNPHKSPWQQIQ